MELSWEAYINRANDHFCVALGHSAATSYEVGHKLSDWLALPCFKEVYL